MKKQILSLSLALAMALTLLPAAVSAADPSAGEIIQFGAYDWRVLEVKDGKAFIISDKILFERNYHTVHTRITWAESEIRVYLNGEFYSTFSSAQQARITETMVINNDSSGGISGGDDTTDKIFLLSVDEAQHYFANNADRIAYDSKGNLTWWRLRSPGAGTYYTANILSNGQIQESADSIDYPGGIRPAMWITIDGGTPPTNPLDTAADWARPSITRAVAEGLVPQGLQSSYATAELTRAEFSALAVAIYERHMGKTITERKTFPDTTDPNAEKMAALGVMSGDGTNFNPDSGFTREMAARLLINLLEVMGIDLPKVPTTFNDQNLMASWAIEQIGQVQAVGLITGSGGNYDPKGKFTRQAGIMLMLKVWDWLQG